MTVRHERYTIAFQLNEAHGDLISLLRELEAGEYRTFVDEIGVAIRLSFVLGHLCLAWHRRSIPPEHLLELTQPEHDAMSVSIPNWGGCLAMVDLAYAHPGIDLSASRRKSLCASTVSAYVLFADTALRVFAERVDAGQFDLCDENLLGDEFIKILESLCLAWHFQWLRPDEVASIAPALIEELAHKVPQWQWDMVLVS
jgi:hypothetical protein